MYQSRIRAAAEYDAAAIHPMACPCPDCSANSDPIGHGRARRVVRVQAAALVASLFAFYALAAWCAPGVVAAFSVGGR